MKKTPHKALVLLSGGMDSVTLLHYVRQRLLNPGEELYAISFNYGQRHWREVEAAKAQVDLADVKIHFIIELDIFSPLKTASVLLDEEGILPSFEEASQPDVQPSTYVPFRNTVLLSIACAYAEAYKMKDVYYAAQESDYTGYWDCRPEYVDAMNKVTDISPLKIKIHAPFVDRTKFWILKEGINLGVDYSKTWSCYKGGDLSCGECPACVSRLKAFEKLGAPDVLRYEGG